MPNYRERFDILAVADNDPKKQSGTVMGIDIIHPQQIPHYDYDYIVITSTSIQPILDQLLSMGIPPDKIKQYVDHVAISRQPFPWDGILFLLLAASLIAYLISLLLAGGQG